MAVSHEHATVAEEEYLQTLFWLYEAGLPMTGANLARAMQLSAPTVHEMVGRLERDGYITRGEDKSIAFTDDGRDHAEEIIRRHRLIERFLTDVLGIPWDEVHEEAERMEHAMSPRFEAYVQAAIGDATTCPHGHPIDVGERILGVPLADCEEGARVRSCASRTRPRTCCTTSRTPASSPASTARSQRSTTSTSPSSPPTASTSSPAASPRPSRSPPTPRRRRAPRCPRQLVLGGSLRPLGGATPSDRTASARRATPSSICGTVTPE